MTFINKKVPIAIPVDFKVKFSKPIVYIPSINGKPDINKNWYVSYYYRDPASDKLVKFILKKGINRFKTLGERKAAAHTLRKAIHLLLQNGYNPFDDVEVPKINDDDYTVMDAFELAFETKKKEWSENTINTNKAVFGKFKQWLILNNYDSVSILLMKRRHMAMFINSLGIGNAGINNYIKLLSSLWGNMIKIGIVESNIMLGYSKLKVEPQKNKPFSSDQISLIKNELKDNQVLYDYILFITYGFLRPVEVNRLQVKDIDNKTKRIYLKAKTGNQIIPIIDKLQSVVDRMQLVKYKSNDFVFTPDGHPGPWNTQHEKGKYDWFQKQFEKIKKKLGFGSEYGLYSFRHSFILDLYRKYVADGMTELETKHKLLPITRHKSLSGLQNYLRDIGAYVPDDYSGDYTLDL